MVAWEYFSYVWSLLWHSHSLQDFERRNLVLRCCCLHVAGGCPAASYFLLLRQKKVTKEKATRISRRAKARGSQICESLTGAPQLVSKMKAVLDCSIERATQTVLA
jgi:hypothetical protein